MRALYAANSILWIANTVTWWGFAHSIPMAVLSACAAVGAIVMATKET